MRLNERNENKITDTLIKTGLGLGGLWIFGGWVKDYFAQNQASKNDLPTQQAQLMRACFNRSGLSWLSWADGTDSKKLLEIAPKIKDWGGVVSAYKNLYGENLAELLTSELDVEDLQKFYLYMGKSELAKQYISDFTRKYKFKLPIGTRVKNNGNGGVCKYWKFFSSPVKTFKAMIVNKTPNSTIGTICGFKVQKLIEGNTVTMQNLYLVKDLPNFPNEQYYVFERDVIKQ